MVSWNTTEHQWNTSYIENRAIAAKKGLAFHIPKRCKVALL
jgi:hypothetical protein